MDEYAAALAGHLAGQVRQEDFASAIQCSQAAVSRYGRGIRFPSLSTAQLIETATGGAVPLSLWQRVAARKLGIDAARRTQEAQAA